MAGAKIFQIGDLLIEVVLKHFKFLGILKISASGIC